MVVPFALNAAISLEDLVVEPNWDGVVGIRHNDSGAKQKTTKIRERCWSEMRLRFKQLLGL